MAKDKFHDTVVNALKKGGWKILKEQVRLIVENRRLWIDVRASNEAIGDIILVEIKSFASPPSDVAYLEQLLGQYLLYRAIIEDIEWSEELYLAIPKSAYDGIFSEKIGKLILQKFQIKLIIVDDSTEQVLLWIH